MAAATKERGKSKQAPRFASARQAREILERLLEDLSGDEKAAAALASTGMRTRYSFPDIGLTLNVAADEERRGIRWAFSDKVSWKPKLRLEMAGDVANRYLQGAVNVPIAIARGEISCKGDARAALLYLPAARLLVGPYRKLLGDRYPDLLIERS